MDNSKKPKRWTEEEERAILSVMGDDLVYNCVKKLVETLIAEEGARTMRLLREDKPIEECLALLRSTRGGIKYLDKLFAYLEGWRQRAIKIRKEEEDARKKEKERNKS